MAGVLIALTSPARADSGCTLVTDFVTAEILHETGDCKTRRGAQSTFKIPLAVMGFDSGILKNQHEPVWPYEKNYNSSREDERKETDPKRWEEYSVVWFSQKLTKTLGIDRFRQYVEKFNYGNKDITGDPSKNNGLTNSWLSSSLKISPIEQTGFLRRLLSKDLGVSDHTYEMTMSILPEFEAGEWKVVGKT